MTGWPETIEEARSRKYDVNGIRPEGIPYKENRCAASVTDFTGWHSYQCQFRNGKGPDKLYCGIHAKAFGK
jgi:hypothetical protein